MSARKAFWRQNAVLSEDLNDETRKAHDPSKKANVFTHINNALVVVLAVVMILLYSFCFVVGSVMLILWLQHIGIMLVAIGILLFIYLKLMRKIRKRAKFMRRLKKQCRQYGYKLERKRGFFKGLRQNTQGFDFLLKTERKLWCVRFYTPRKRLSHLTFLDKDTVEVTTNIVQSRFKFVLGFNRTVKSRRQYSFEDALPLSSMKAVRALIINPVPHEVFRKDDDGARIAIGSGQYLYGYSMYTGSGFLETIMRDSAE